MCVWAQKVHAIEWDKPYTAWVQINHLERRKYNTNTLLKCHINCYSSNISWIICMAFSNYHGYHLH